LSREPMNTEVGALSEMAVFMDRRDKPADDE
jgi:hypothetical protein